MPCAGVWEPAAGSLIFPKFRKAMTWRPYPMSPGYNLPDDWSWRAFDAWWGTEDESETEEHEEELAYCAPCDIEHDQPQDCPGHDDYEPVRGLDRYPEVRVSDLA